MHGIRGDWMGRNGKRILLSNEKGDNDNNVMDYDFNNEKSLIPLFLGENISKDKHSKLSRYHQNRDIKEDLFSDNDNFEEELEDKTPTSYNIELEQLRANLSSRANIPIPKYNGGNF